MAVIQIPDELDAKLQNAAENLNRTKEDFLCELLASYLEEEHASHAIFTEDQIARFKRSIAQVERGEVYNSEQVDEFFVGWFKELEAR